MTRLDEHNLDHLGFRLHKRSEHDWSVYYYGHCLADHFHGWAQAARYAETLAPYFYPESQVSSHAH